MFYRGVIWISLSDSFYILRFTFNSTYILRLYTLYIQYLSSRPSYILFPNVAQLHLASFDSVCGLCGSHDSSWSSVFASWGSFCDVISLFLPELSLLLDIYSIKCVQYLKKSMNDPIHSPIFKGKKHQQQRTVIWYNLLENS